MLFQLPRQFRLLRAALAGDEDERRTMAVAVGALFGLDVALGPVVIAPADLVAQLVFLVAGDVGDDDAAAADIVFVHHDEAARRRTLPEQVEDHGLAGFQRQLGDIVLGDEILIGQRFQRRGVDDVV